MICSVDVQEPNWVSACREAVDVSGVCILEKALSADLLQKVQHALFEAREQIRTDVPAPVLQQAIERGDNSLRFLMSYNPIFINILGEGVICETVHQVLSPHAVIKFQNGFIQDDASSEDNRKAAQRHFHRNTRQFHGSFRTSIDLVFWCEEMNASDSMFFVCPGSHRMEDISLELLEKIAVPVAMPPGSILIFDSQLYHYEGQCASGQISTGLGQQFTMPYIKQHIDLVRLLGDDCVRSYPEPVQTFLGYQSRIPSSQAEFYLPPDQRFYRAGMS